MIGFNPNASPAEQRQQLGNVVEHLSRLLQSPGWELYDKYLQSEEARILNDIARAKTGEEALRAATAYSVVSSMRTLPMRTVQAGLAQLAEKEQ